MSLLAYAGLSGDLVMEPGPVELSAGSSESSERDLRSTAKLTVTGKTRPPLVVLPERGTLSISEVSAPCGYDMNLGRTPAGPGTGMGPK